MKDFVPFIRGVRVLCKPRFIFSRINGPNVKEIPPRINMTSQYPVTKLPVCDRNVTNVIEATFGTSLSPLFIQHGGLQRSRWRVVNASANNLGIHKNIQRPKKSRTYSKRFLDILVVLLN